MKKPMSKGERLALILLIALNIAILLTNIAAVTFAVMHSEPATESAPFR